MIVTVVGINKEGIGIDVTFAFASSFHTTVPRLTLEQIAICIVPENAVTYIRLCSGIGFDAVFVINHCHIAYRWRTTGNKDSHETISYDKILQYTVGAFAVVKGDSEIVWILQYSCTIGALHCYRLTQKIDFSGV
ncbi:hypothetical protein ES703_113133 [subsurface metagenome]